MTEAPDNDKPKNETSSEQMRKIFAQAYFICRISDFLDKCFFSEIRNVLPLVASREEIIELVDRFIKTIEYDVIELYSFERSEIMYIKISQYTRTLREYRNYIIENKLKWQQARRMNDFKMQGGKIISVSIDEDAFDKAVEYFRQRLNTLYNEICGRDIE